MNSFPANDLVNMEPIKIIFEDEDLLVLDKPAGITVNRSETTKEPTIQDWTDEKLQISNDKLSIPQDKIEDYTSDEYFQQTFLQRGGIVHRLDKETSGILLVAKNWQTFKNLQAQFHDRVVEKTYLALVHGVLTPREGEIAIPVDRLPWDRHRFGVVPGGRPSVTIYQTLKLYVWKKRKQEKLSLVELYPKTGRTHQIRVHLKYLNHPIISDMLYAGRKTSRDDRRVLSRVFLHAAGIKFKHPKTGEDIEFKSELTTELQEFISSELEVEVN